MQIFNVDISAALIDTFVTGYLPALAEKSGGKAETWRTQKRRDAFWIFSRAILKLLLVIWTIGFLQDPWEN
ncbi:hypothetical protein A9X61_20535 [Enterobacter asburiae]|nr:hypothetical protein UO97_07940 [Enterobacter asburiae]OAZ90543.1 hypothetical protein A9X61_20535 [Enterobacter asburiae]